MVLPDSILAWPTLSPRNKPQKLRTSVPALFLHVPSLPFFFPSERELDFKYQIAPAICHYYTPYYSLLSRLSAHKKTGEWNRFHPPAASLRRLPQPIIPAGAVVSIAMLQYSAT
jgi:hypothetical protein